MTKSWKQFQLAVLIVVVHTRWTQKNIKSSKKFGNGMLSLFVVIPQSFSAFFHKSISDSHHESLLDDYVFFGGGGSVHECLKK